MVSEQPFMQTLERRVILARGRYLTVEAHTVQLPDGTRIPDWDWIITPDYVNIAAVTHSGAYLCFRQPKYGITGTSLAPVGGYIDAGETPLQAAQRELLEELGCEADQWLSLGQYTVDGNRGAGTAHLFLARGARQVRAAAPETADLETQIPVTLSRHEVAQALRDGEFKVLAWGAVMALALLHHAADEC